MKAVSLNGYQCIHVPPFYFGNLEDARETIKTSKPWTDGEIDLPTMREHGIVVYDQLYLVLGSESPSIVNKGEVRHPHAAQDSAIQRICCGSAETVLHNCIKKKDTKTFVQVALEVLNSYNETAAYEPLQQIIGYTYKCEKCGEDIERDEMVMGEVEGCKRCLKFCEHQRRWVNEVEETSHYGWVGVDILMDTDYNGKVPFDQVVTDVLGKTGRRDIMVTNGSHYIRYNTGICTPTGYHDSSHCHLVDGSHVLNEEYKELYA